MLKQRLALLALLFALLYGTGCTISLKGTSIPPEVTTYYVDVFNNNAANAPPTLAIEVTEALKEKIRRESRLVFADTNPDVEFKGSVVDFRVSAEAPQPGEVYAKNRLTIVTAVEYISHARESDGFKKNFSFFFDFDANQDLASVQQQAIDDILLQMTEDIFNAAFTSW